ncbi:MAG: PKD domain-containing protein [Calditrichia bacterium]
MKRFKITGAFFSTMTVLFVWLVFITAAMSHGNSDYYPNSAPRANAGADKILYLPNNSVSLQSNAIDEDGSVSFYYWAQVAGPSAAGMAKPFTSELELSNLQEGHYTFRLVVIDNEGHPAEDDVEVIVQPRG